MTLLFDHNLSPRLAIQLRDLFPESRHVRDVGLAESLDRDVWLFAQHQGYTIITKDADFYDVSTMHGSPPKVIWLRIGNCTTAIIEGLIRTHTISIVAFLADASSGVLTLQ